MMQTKELHDLAGRSLDIHCHGVGQFDFTEITPPDLADIESLLKQRNQNIILTSYLPKARFDAFLHLMECFHAGREAGKFKHIVGFSLEGPLLASHGGTPAQGVWAPTKQQWLDIADCGRLGLLYNIFSPDAMLPGSVFGSTYQAPTMTWITETLLEGGVLPTPGHFIKSDPIKSAQALQAILDVVAAWGRGATVIDHLFNDMPRNFKHAWRLPLERKNKADDLKNLQLHTWNNENLEEKLGPVPAVLIRNAHKGIVKLCQNFDGEHVDLAIVKKAVELIGAENMIMMTDSTEGRRLGGQVLHTQPHSTLLYQEQGIVAAGGQNVIQQIKNMYYIGMNTEQISLITHHVPYKIVQQQKNYFMEEAYAN